MKTNLLRTKLIFLAGILLIVSGVALFISIQNQQYTQPNKKNNRIDTKEEVLKRLHEFYPDECDYQYKKTEKGKIIFECNEENYKRMYLFDIEKQSFTTETVVFYGNN